MPYIDPAACLEQPQRRFIYEQIRDRPGRTLSDLLRATGLGSATVLWHTQKLEQARLVVSENHLGLRLYHATQNGLPGKQVGRAVALLGDRRSRGIREFVALGVHDADAICRALRSDRRRVLAVLEAMRMQTQPDFGIHWGLTASFPLAIGES
jgi:predicted transcriptional regulator